MIDNSRFSHMFQKDTVHNTCGIVKSDKERVSYWGIGKQTTSRIASFMLVFSLSPWRFFMTHASVLAVALAVIILRSVEAYTLRPLCPVLGFKQVEGFDLRMLLKDHAALDRLRADIDLHRLIVFRGQHALDGKQQLELSEAMGGDGSLDHGLYRAHPLSPDPRLLRVSNDDTHGFTGVGTSGWHLDGVMIKAPFSVQTMHFLSTIDGGDTRFLGLRELLRRVPTETLERWRRLWFVSGVGDLAVDGTGDGQLALHPLVTYEGEMVFHTGDGYCVAWIMEESERPRDAGRGVGVGLLDSLARHQQVLWGSNPGGNMRSSDDALAQLLGCECATVLPAQPTQRELAHAIDEAIATEADGAEPCSWTMRWRDGDFAFINNRALAHCPVPGTQVLPAECGGVRIFHRSTVSDPSAVPQSVRGAESVVLTRTRPPGVARLPRARGALEDSATLRRVLSRLVRVGSRA